MARYPAAPRPCRTRPRPTAGFDSELRVDRSPPGRSLAPKAPSNAKTTPAANTSKHRLLKNRRTWFRLGRKVGEHRPVWRADKSPSQDLFKPTTASEPLARAAIFLAFDAVAGDAGHQVIPAGPRQHLVNQLTLEATPPAAPTFNVQRRLRQLASARNQPQPPIHPS
jgi:hypothetical protein